MSHTIIEIIDQRLGYHDSVVIDRDEFNELEAALAESDDLYDATQKEIEALEGVKKQLDMAREIIEGVVECIDDDGVVTPADKKHLANRIKAAVKFTSNLEG